MGFSDVYTPFKVFVFIRRLLVVLQIVGITNYLASISAFGYTGTSDLWKTCIPSKCKIMSSGFPRWWVAVLAFGTIGKIVVTVSVTLTFLSIFVFTKAGHKIVYIVNMILAFIGGGAFLLCDMIFGANFTSYRIRTHLSWSFGLSIVGGILYEAVMKS